MQYLKSFASDIGNMTVRGTEHAITEVGFRKSKKQNSNHLLDRLSCDLRLYAKGKNPDLGKYPLDLSSHTPFEQKVYCAARRIPNGSTSTYSDISRAIDNPNSQRAVDT